MRAEARGGRPLRIVLAPDKFKGTLTARQAAAAMADGARRVAPDADVVLLPIADGGEGTVAAFVAAGAREVRTTVSGPLGRPVLATWARRGEVAVIESAQANGLDLVLPDSMTALAATTFGVGQLITAALDAGCSRLVLAVGGSATTDGGLGMAQALGVVARDRNGQSLPTGGGALERLTSLSMSGLDPRLRSTSVVVACDVDNPLTGPAGAAAVYAPQKGAGPRQVETLERGLVRLASVVGDLNPSALPGGEGTRSFAAVPGAGAAGGLAGGAIVFLGGELTSGAELVLGLIGADAALVDADLVITGEGSLDDQSLNGKAPGVAAAHARLAGADVLAVAGVVQIGPSEVAAAGISHAFALVDIAGSQADAMARAAELLATRTATAVEWWLAGQDASAP
jgi:glycerate kinase